jgi:hypothetical protein
MYIISVTKPGPLPPSNAYTQPGERLTDIAVRFRTNMDLLLSLNPDLPATFGPLGAAAAAAAGAPLPRAQPLCILPCTEAASAASALPF